MREEFNMVLVLVLISILSAISLSYVDGITRLKIEQNKIGALKNSLLEVMPEAEYFNEIEPGDNMAALYEALDSSMERTGFVVLAQRSGYQGNVKVLYSVKGNEISGIKILEQFETPGLGARIEEKGFTGQFVGEPLENQKVDAITGATISSKAVINSVKESSTELMKMIEAGEI